MTVFSWTTPTNISNSEMVSADPSIAIGKDNLVHVVWDERDDHTEAEIFYSYCMENSWIQPINVSHNSYFSWLPTIATDTTGYPHVVWTDSGDDWLYWSFFNGENWVTPEDIFNQQGLDYMPRMVSDELNQLHLVWYNWGTNNEIWYANYNGSSWSSPINVTNDEDDSAFPDIAIDSEGNIHVVWINYGAAGHPDSIDIYYSKYDGLSWSIPVNISNLVGSSCYPLISIDSRNSPHVVWEERWTDTIGHYSPYYTFFDSTYWSEPYMLTDSCENGIEPIIGVDSKDRVHILWTKGEFGGGIFYRYLEGDTFSNSYELSDTGWVPSIAIDYDDNLHVVFGVFGEIYYCKHVQTGINFFEDNQSFLKQFRLNQNFPNPFIEKTIISYYVPYECYVGITIYDIAGRMIESIDLGCSAEGFNTYTITKNRLINRGSGIYYYQLDASNHTLTRKMVFCRTM